VGKLRLELDREDFLSSYWQQKPLLIRQAIPGFAPPLDTNELAGLALEETIESRIIEYRDDSWQLSHGPFEADDFQREHPWTLLVQAVDHYIPEVAQLRQLVDFIPNWRIDDVMVSYAVDGGSVGPHYDNYDVFLLQGEGSRKWQVGQACNASSPLLPHRELRILEEFNIEQEYTLQAGDLLYLPPGVAHWGIAQGECMTFSIGFRAPRINDLVSRRVDAVLEHIDAEQFYRDPRLSSNSRAGEIRRADLLAAKQQVMTALDNEFDETWFGEMLTEPKYDGEDEFDAELPTTAELQQTGGSSRLSLVPSSKIAWQQTGDSIVVFANGDALPHSTVLIPLVSKLCQEWAIEGNSVSEAMNNPECAILIQQLLERGCLEYD